MARFVLEETMAFLNAWIAGLTNARRHRVLKGQKGKLSKLHVNHLAYNIIYVSGAGYSLPLNDVEQTTCSDVWTK